MVAVSCDESVDQGARVALRLKCPRNGWRDGRVNRNRSGRRLRRYGTVGSVPIVGTASRCLTVLLRQRSREVEDGHQSQLLLIQFVQQQPDHIQASFRLPQSAKHTVLKSWRRLKWRGGEQRTTLLEDG